MGFNSVYRSLHEIFPQVDARVLKAVAVENAQNLQSAVESILSDLPYLEKEAVPLSFNSGDHGHKPSVSHERHQPSQAVSVTNTFPLESGSAPAGADETSKIYDSRHAAPMVLNETVTRSSESSFYDAKNNNGQFAEFATGKDTSLSDTYEGVASELSYDDSTLGSPIENRDSNKDKKYGLNRDDGNPGLQKCPEHDGDMAVNNTLHTSTSSSDASDHVLDCHLINGLIMKASCSSDSCSSSINEGIDVSQEKQPSPSSYSPELDNYVELETSFKSNIGDSNDSCLAPHLPIKNLAPEGSEDLPLDFERQALSSSAQILEHGLPISDDTSKQAGELSGNANNDDSSLVNSIVTRSGQVCRIDLLEDIIVDAKSHKKRLFSAMETVMKLMREVEVKEKDAEQAKEEAARGGVEILASVDKLKVMIKSAVEANEMHSGEVYGERAILATEVKELQNRLFSLAEERDKQLAILDEMRKSLQARMDAAEKEVMEAEIEKLEKEEAARKALAEQEYIMEKVVEESKILKQEAEENERLREFLDVRGRMVDTLQGEISVICQDVKLLKENLDKRIPLSQYLSSKQTSCILAASSSFSVSASSQKSNMMKAYKSEHRLGSEEGTTEPESSDDDDAKAIGYLEEQPLGGEKAVTPFPKEVSHDDWVAV